MSHPPQAWRVVINRGRDHTLTAWVRPAGDEYRAADQGGVWCRGVSPRHAVVALAAKRYTMPSHRIDAPMSSAASVTVIDRSPGPSVDVATPSNASVASWPISADHAHCPTTPRARRCDTGLDGS